MTRSQEDWLAGSIIALVVVLVAVILINGINKSNIEMNKVCAATLAVANSPTDSLALLAAQPNCAHIIHK